MKPSATVVTPELPQPGGGAVSSRGSVILMTFLDGSRARGEDALGDRGPYDYPNRLICVREVRAEHVCRSSIEPQPEHVRRNEPRAFKPHRDGVCRTAPMRTSLKKLAFDAPGRPTYQTRVEVFRAPTTPTLPFADVVKTALDAPARRRISPPAPARARDRA